uniref:RAP domain-containing protein n=1 Tax=Arcella intermedia TaxID=1963864 RepID=A0A6B2L7Z6_9EUKA
MYADYWISYNFLIDNQRGLQEMNVKMFLECPGGPTLLTLFNGSPFDYLNAMYPELGDLKCEGIWSRKVSIEGFLLDFFEDSLWTLKDLSTITKSRFIKYPGGNAILRCHRNSPHLIFQKAYPECMAKFGQRVFRGVWKNKQTNKLIQQAMKHYHIKETKDWYKLSVDQISKLYGRRVSKMNVVRLLDYWFPEEEWEYSKFSEVLNKRSCQRYLGLKLLELFKDEVIIQEYPIRTPNKLHIFDFYIPGRKLIIEYQGELHYYAILNWVSWDELKKKDEEKIRLCESHGLRLVCIPYWWDHSLSALHLIINSKMQTITDMKELHNTTSNPNIPNIPNLQANACQHINES